MGETQNQPFQLSFNTSLKIDFPGSRVTSDGGLILVRELVERLGFGVLIHQHLSDSRRGKNTQFPFVDEPSSGRNERGCGGGEEGVEGIGQNRAPFRALRGAGGAKPACSVAPFKVRPGWCLYFGPVGWYVVARPGAHNENSG